MKRITLAVSVYSLVLMVTLSAAQDDLVSIHTDPAAFVLSADDLPDWAPDPRYRDYGSRTEVSTGGAVSFEEYGSGILAQGSLTVSMDATIYPSLDAALAQFAATLSADSEDATRMQVQLSLADDASGFRRSFASSQTASVQLRFRNVIASVAVTSLDGTDVPDQMVNYVARTLADKVQAGVLGAQEFDWGSIAPGTLRPWDALLDSNELGSGYKESQSIRGEGADVIGKPTSDLLSAYRVFTGRGDTSVTSHVVVFGDASAAMQEMRTWAGVFGTRGDFSVQTLGDDTSTLKLTSEDGQRVEYRVKFRHGAIVDELDADGPTSAPPRPDQVVKWAQQADAKLAAALDRD